MNNRRDEQYGRQQFGRHNQQFEDERYRERSAGRQAGETPRAREGFGGEWRTEGLGPVLARRWPNENLANDFSIEGTRNFSRDERRGARVNHRGKGPKGFTRSDERIREDVCQILTDHQDVDASDIEVEVKNAEVTLSGTVVDRWTKRLAEAVVENVSGIADIHNRLRVGREQAPQSRAH